MARTDPDISPAPPATERGRRTRRKLLDAATIEFGERGFHEASIASITRRAGVALGSFYTYFGSKEALFSAVLEKTYENIRLAERQLDLAHKPPVEAMRELIGFGLTTAPRSP